MPTKPTYEIYCLYHNKVNKKYYGNQIDQVTFVKMDRGSYIFRSKKHIHLVKEPWFEPIGKEWAEYEFYYSLYQGYKKGLVELPEYMGFIQYDMEFNGKEEKYKNVSVIDFVEDLIQKKQLDEKILVSFQPNQFENIYNQNYIMDRRRPNVQIDPYFENCIDTILRENNELLNTHLCIEDFFAKRLSLCGAFFVHRIVFLNIMNYMEKIITDGRLSMFKDRFSGGADAGGYTERYIALYLETLGLYTIEFDLPHHFITGHVILGYHSNKFLNKNKFYGLVGRILKSKVPFIYKILKPYFN